MKKLAIFDLDGTLFNTENVNYWSYSTALKEKNYNIDYDYYCKYCNGRHYKVFLPSIVKNNEEIIEYVHKRKKELYPEFLNKAIPNEHLFNIIKGLKEDYYLAVVTTASKKNTYEILEYFQKKDFFDLIITQEDIVKPKPDPEGFIKAMEYFNITPNNTIIFEDSEVGIEAAISSKASVFKVIKFK